MVAMHAREAPAALLAAGSTARRLRTLRVFEDGWIGAVPLEAPLIWGRHAPRASVVTRSLEAYQLRHAILCPWRGTCALSCLSFFRDCIDAPLLLITNPFKWQILSAKPHLAVALIELGFYRQPATLRSFASPNKTSRSNSPPNQIQYTVEQNGTTRDSGPPAMTRPGRFRYAA